MSRKFLTPVGVVALASAPSIASVGDTYWDTTFNSLYTYDGSTWVTSVNEAAYVSPIVEYLNSGVAASHGDVIYDAGVGATSSSWTYTLVAGGATVSF